MPALLTVHVCAFLLLIPCLTLQNLPFSTLLDFIYKWATAEICKKIIFYS